MLPKLWHEFYKQMSSMDCHVVFHPHLPFFLMLWVEAPPWSLVTFTFTYTTEYSFVELN